MLKRLSFTAALLSLAASPAFAHLDPAAHGSLKQASRTRSSAPITSWPWSPWVWASQIGGRALWLFRLPLSL